MEHRFHAVLLPGPALGHVHGMLQLGRALLSVGFQVTIVRFQRSYVASFQFSPPIPAGAALRVLPDGLSVIGDGAFIDVFATGPAMHESLCNFLLDVSPPPACIVADIMMAWTQNVADDCGLPRVEFSTASAMSYLLLMAFPEILAKLKESKELPKFLDCIPGLPKFPLEDVPPEMLVLDESVPIIETASLSARNVRRANRVFIHSTRDLEPSSFHALAKLGINVFPVGPFIAPYAGANSDGISWLDGHSSRSVLYVAFGTNVELSPQEICEIAVGLQSSGQPFLWVVRTESMVSLPGGFQERLGGKGLIIPWAPQVAVLEHAAVGGFMTHCGWNSVMESVWMGVPMLAYPKRADQFMNMRMVVEVWGVGLRLVSTPPLARSDVDGGVKALLRGEAGKLVWGRVQDLSKVVRKASDESNMSLVKFMEDMRPLKIE